MFMYQETHPKLKNHPLNGGVVTFESCNQIILLNLYPLQGRKARRGTLKLIFLINGGTKPMIEDFGLL